MGSGVSTSSSLVQSSPHLSIVRMNLDIADSRWKTPPSPTKDIDACSAAAHSFRQPQDICNSITNVQPINLLPRDKHPLMCLESIDSFGSGRLYATLQNEIEL